MPREHWNDVPGDIAAGDAQDLAGGFGVDDADNSPDATIDELIDNDVIAPVGPGFARQDLSGGTTSGTDYANGTNSGSTINPNELVAGEEEHPGAGVGFTGEERDKRISPRMRTTGGKPAGAEIAGGSDEAMTHQQQENMSVETEGPAGGQGSAEHMRPGRGKKAA